MSSLSGLSFIDVKDKSSPFSLFFHWLDEAKSCGVNTNLLPMNLATAKKNGKVSNRTVLIREIFPDGSLVFTTQSKSNKVQDITENPQVAVTILLIYEKNGEKVVNQVRFCGEATLLLSAQGEKYFSEDSLPGKIRTWICKECTATQWEDLKANHDEMLKEVLENKKALKAPETQLAYKIVPYEADFYLSVNNNIADRVVFKRNEDSKWFCERIMA